MFPSYTILKMCAKYRNGFKCQIEVQVTRLREWRWVGMSLRYQCMRRECVQAPLGDS